ncbi:uncharacterized protein LY89DRAFT_743832 [Mollisia scopiformis]|uniref:5'-deoxynucleotidase n=1 Tax=Mollisia scopiformis TaxID=149040 RepID=A0A132B298_MOLSC|nr:uncharacterized protein LY89DRAFT_743832 [Mollisia scopiformis]KUJ06510.1 hypothetical protein LY89DRAFT_743832 [Mollisia scopiformis]
MAANGETKINGEAAPGILTARSAEAPWSVESVLASIPGGAPEENSSSPVPFFHMLERLKTTKREGWRRFGIQHGESIADHMYRMSLITMFAPPSLASRIDIQRCTKMALIHDMAEALVGDITPVDGVAKHEKNRRESTTMDYFEKGLLGRVNGGMTGKDIKAIWQEYEDSETLESKFVHDVDKIELILQMVEYEKAEGCKLDLGEFSWVASRISLDEVKEWSRTILKEREDLWAGREHSTYSEESPPDPVALAQKKEYYDHRTPNPPLNGHD